MDTRRRGIQQRKTMKESKPVKLKKVLTFRSSLRRSALHSTAVNTKVKRGTWFQTPSTEHMLEDISGGSSIKNPSTISAKPSGDRESRYGGLVSDKGFNKRRSKMSASSSELPTDGHVDRVVGLAIRLEIDAIITHGTPSVSESGSTDGEESTVSISQTVDRSSLIRRRTLIRVPSLKLKKRVNQKPNGDSGGHDFSAHRPTCSSMLKNSNLVADEAEKTFPKSVCTYTHCSLHGRRHNTSLPLNGSCQSSRKVKSHSIFSDADSPQDAFVGSPTSSALTALQGRGAAGDPEKNGSCSESSDDRHGDHYLDRESFVLTPQSDRFEDSTVVASVDSRKEKTYDSPCFLADCNDILGRKLNAVKEERGNHARLWQFLYQNAKTYVAKDNGSTSSATEGKNSPSMLPKISSASSANSHELDGNVSEELNQTDAVALVKEAIDAVFPPTPHSLQDNESVESETTSTTGSCHLDDQAKPGKNWKKLKRIILLNRFIKEIERRRSFKEGEGLGGESEQEKVNLRHRISEERKHGHQWMLDYALQHVIAQLTPGRKKRVELLIEAFETVNLNLSED